MKLTWLAGLLVATALPAAAQARWHGGWGFGFGVGVPAYCGPSFPAYSYFPPGPVYTAPPVVYSSPAPVFASPTFVAPARAFVPPPVVYSPGFYVGFGPRYSPFWRHRSFYRRW